MNTTTALVLTLLTASSVAWRQQAEPPTTRYFPSQASQTELQEVYHVWEETLRAICDVEGIEAMVFDIEPAYEYIEPWEKRLGAEAMRLFAFGSKRRWLQVDGVQVFTRVGYNYRTNRYTETLLDLLRSMDEETLKQLTNEGVRLSELGSARDQVLPRLALDPAMAKVLAERGGEVLVQATFAPQFEYTDPKTGASRVTQLGSMDANRPPRMPVTESGGGRAPVPYEPHNPGPLDFGPGKVMTLQEFKLAAEKQFATVYEIDGRLVSAPVFVRGSMTKETFGKVYREVASAQHPLEAEPAPTQQEPSLAELLGSTASVLGAASAEDLYGLDPDDFINGRSMTAGQLAALDPAIGEQLAGLGLSPSDQVRLKPGVIFIFDAGGSRTIGFSGSGSRRITLAASNRLRLGIR